MLNIEKSRRLSPVTAGLCFRETARNRGRLISKSAMIWNYGEHERLSLSVMFQAHAIR